MKRNATAKVVLATAAILALSACSGQDKQHTKTKQDEADITQQADTPKVNIRVNKKYDPQGNLIAYDSTYSKVYDDANASPAQLDSILQDFRQQFGQQHGFLNDPGFNDLFFPDSMPGSDFFYNDFFRKRMELNEQYLQRMMTRMDSLKNAYFEDRRPQAGSAPKSGK